MHEKHLRSIDLNLLVVLDALLRTSSVTVAARQLAMTQPAVSHALQRLRQLFADPLLQRQGRRMQATPRAQALAAPLARWLADLRQLTTGLTPDLSTPRTLRVSMPDVAMATLLPSLVRELQQSAPGLTLICLEWQLPQDEIERLRRGEVDLVLSGLAASPPDLRRERLGTVDFVGLAAADHPVLKDPELDAFDFPFVIVSAVGGTRGELDGLLASQGRERRLAVSVPSYLSLPPLLAGSRLLALVPRALAELGQRQHRLASFPAPAGLHPQPLDLVWHQRSEGDGLHAQLREQLARVARQRLTSGNA